MALHNISQAAKLVGLSRTHFYNKYVNKGLLTISKDNKDSPMVDTSELIRVFGTLHVDSTKSVNTIQEFTPIKDTEISLLRELIKAKDEQLNAAKEREDWLKSKVDEYANAVKLIAPPVKKKGWFSW